MITCVPLKNSLAPCIPIHELSFTYTPSFISTPFHPLHSIHVLFEYNGLTTLTSGIRLGNCLSCPSSHPRYPRVHLTGGKSPVTGDFYRYRYLAATLTGSGNRCFSIQNLKIQKKTVTATIKTVKPTVQNGYRYRWLPGLEPYVWIGPGKASSISLACFVWFFQGNSNTLTGNYSVR